MAGKEWARGDEEPASKKLDRAVATEEAKLINELGDDDDTTDEERIRSEGRSLQVFRRLDDEMAVEAMKQAAKKKLATQKGEAGGRH